jgi:integrase/recombinase XerD
MRSLNWISDQPRDILALSHSINRAMPSTVLVNRAALRFVYVCTLKQNWFEDEIPHPKRRLTLPGILSTEEVTRMLDGTHNLKHWSILATFYATALRCSELQHLRVDDIDSKRLVLHVREGKGRIPRDIALSAILFERLRIYFRQYRPKDWLFPSRQNHGSMMEDRSLRYVCRQAAKRAGIKRRVHPHLFRHACATHMLDAGADLRTIRCFLGMPTSAPRLAICTYRSSVCRPCAVPSMHSSSGLSIRPEITNRTPDATSAGSRRCLSSTRPGVLCPLGTHGLRCTAQSIPRHLRLSHCRSRRALPTV